MAAYKIRKEMEKNKNFKSKLKSNALINLKGINVRIEIKNFIDTALRNSFGHYQQEMLVLQHPVSFPYIFAQLGHIVPPSIRILHFEGF